MITSSCSPPTVAAAVAVVVLAGAVFAALTVHHGRRTVAHHEQTLGVLRDLVLMYEAEADLALGTFTYGARGLALASAWQQARALTGVPSRWQELRVVGDEERNG